MTAAQIGALGAQALRAELDATPKPGLVDRRNAGAHRDMDAQTFVASIAAIAPFFAAFAALGEQSGAQTPKQLFASLREAGRQAEQAMFAATDGVNTHKGGIFSLGLCCAAAGRLCTQGQPPTVQAVCNLVAAMTAGICEAEYANLLQKDVLTKGEQMYLRYGVTGVRGEAESGFQTVRRIALPVYRAARAQGVCENDAMVQTLLCLLCETIDTNILSRSDLCCAQAAQRQARLALDAGGMLGPCGRQRLEALDDWFIAQNISPGGCADLLGVTHLLHALEQGIT